MRIAWKLLKNIIIVTHKKVVLENNATSLTYINGYTGFSIELTQKLLVTLLLNWPKKDLLVSIDIQIVRGIPVFNFFTASD